MRLLWDTLILLVLVPQLCYVAASLASFCSLAQRTKYWNASRYFPSANTVLQCLYSEIFPYLSAMVLNPFLLSPV